MWCSLLPWVLFALLVATPVWLFFRWLWRTFFPTPPPQPPTRQQWRPTVRIGDGPSLQIREWRVEPQPGEAIGGPSPALLNGMVGEEVKFVLDFDDPAEPLWELLGSDEESSDDLDDLFDAPGDGAS
jgi:hypothetical protein